MAISSWGPPPEVPLIALPMMTVLGMLQLPPPSPGTPGPLSRPTPDAISAILQGGGFSGVEVEETAVVVRFASAEEFTTHTRDIVAPLVALLEQQPEDVRDAAWSAVTEAARQHAEADGSVTMTNKALLASGSA